MKNLIALLTLVLFCPQLVFAEQLMPVFNESGPDADSKFCASKGYPVSWKYAKDPCYRVGTFTHYDELMLTHVIAANGPVRALAYAHVDEIAPELDDIANVILEDYPTTSLIIWRDGKVQKEVYQYARKDTDLFHSFSMHKTFTGLLIDQAIQTGLVDHVDDPIVNYLPSLSKTGWKDRTVFHALTMTSGVRWDDKVFYSGLFFKDADRISLIRKEFSRFKKDAGKRYIYTDVNTFLLGLISERVFEKPYAEIFSEKIWQKIGAEADAEILTTKSGQALMGASFRARPRDYLRLGLMILNEGVNHAGEQVISKDWIAALYADTEKVDACPMVPRCNAGVGKERGYSYQTWVPAQDVIMASGRYGQYIIVFRKTNTVIVITSVDGNKKYPKRDHIKKLISVASAEQ